MDIFKRSADPNRSGHNAVPRTPIPGCFDIAWYEAILQNMSDGLMIADASGKIVDMNPAALAMFGFGSREEMIRVMSGDAKVMDITDTEGKELSIGQWPLARAYAGETFSGQEYSVYVRPTKRRWCASFSGAPVLDNAGKIEYAVLTIRDISERKQAEWAAQATHELTQHKLNEVAEYKNRLEAVMQTLPVGVAVLDTQGGTVLANRVFDTIWGNPKPAAKNIGDYIQDKAEWADMGRTIVPDEWASSRALQTGETVIGQIIRITGFDGVQRVVLNSAAPILDAGGEVAGCAVAVQDISEHMALEEALRQSEERYRHLVQYAPAGIYDIDFASGRFTEANDVMCRVLGYTRDELLAMTALDILDEEGKALFALRVRKAKAGERPGGPTEFRVRTKAGRLLWALVNTTYHWNGDSIAGATVVAHDITERKQMEEKLHTALMRLYLILSNMHFGILLVTNENQVEFANQAFCDIFGLKDSPDDLARLSGSEIIDKIRPSFEEPDAAAARIRGIIDNGLPVRSEEIGMRGGRILLREFMPIRIGEETYGRLWVYSDITERKKAEEALRESEAKLRAIFETSVDAIGVSKAGIHIAANPAYLALFGYSDNDGLIGKSITDLIAPDQRPVIAENVHLRARGDSAPSSYETRGLRKDGTEFDMDVRVSAYTVDGEVASVVILRDITDRKRAEEALKISEVRYRRLFEAAKDGILMLDFDTGMIVDVNKFLIDWIEYSFEDLIKKHLWDVGIFKDVVASKDAFAELQKKEFIRYENLPLETKSGKKMAVEFVSNVYLVDHRKVIQCNIRDITERRRAEEEVLRHAEELKAANDELARFNRVAVDRELRMIELKKQVNELCEKAGMEPMYKVEGMESH